MVQRYPSSGTPTELQRPPAPPSVVNAVKLMYAGAAVSTVSLIISLADISGTKAAIRKARPSLTAAQVSQLNTFIISLAIVSGLIGIGLWLWMAWANNKGKNWARILSTVLFGWATLQVFSAFAALPVIHVVPGVEVPGLLGGLLTWLLGGAAVWLLWRPDFSAFFTAQGLVRVPPAGPMPPRRLPRSL